MSTTKLPTAQHICIGSNHGYTYRGFASARYQAAATPLACRIEDRDQMFPPDVVQIQRRAWILPDELAAYSNAIDDAGRKFNS